MRCRVLRNVERLLSVVVAAATFAGPRPVAWAVCADGSTFPAGGYVVGQASVVNWTPLTFTGTLGSMFVPDASVFEHNDPAQPLTGGGHNWVLDQGSTLWKMIDLGPAAGTPTSWELQPFTNSTINSGEMVWLPCVVNGVVTCIGDVPQMSDVITPTCDPTKLSAPGVPNPANTYFNQLGCSISHGVATTPQTATSFLFTTGVKGGLFSIPLKNVANPVVGGVAGKLAGPQNYYSAIPSGQRLTGTAISKDGQFAVATSRFNLNPVYACLNPLGDPGDPSLPINLAFNVPPASGVKCMQVANNNLKVDVADAFGPDDQPYFAGQTTVNSLGGSDPGTTLNVGWPQCIWKNNGSLSLADAFVHNRQNGCGNALPNGGFMFASTTNPTAIVSHGQYLFATSSDGSVVQMKVTRDVSGLSQYQFRTYLRGLPATTGLGVADDLRSLMVYSDPSGIGAAAQEIVWKTPLCEDM